MRKALALRGRAGPGKGPYAIIQRPRKRFGRNFIFTPELGARLGQQDRIASAPSERQGPRPPMGPATPIRAETPNNLPNAAIPTQRKPRWKIVQALINLKISRLNAVRRSSAAKQPPTVAPEAPKPQQANSAPEIPRVAEKEARERRRKKFSLRRLFARLRKKTEYDKTWALEKFGRMISQEKVVFSTGRENHGSNKRYADIRPEELDALYNMEIFRNANIRPVRIWGIEAAAGGNFTVKVYAHERACIVCESTADKILTIFKVPKGKQKAIGEIKA